MAVHDLMWAYWDVTRASTWEEHADHGRRKRSSPAAAGLQHESAGTKQRPVEELGIQYMEDRLRQTLGANQSRKRDAEENHPYAPLQPHSARQDRPDSRAAATRPTTRPARREAGRRRFSKNDQAETCDRLLRELIADAPRPAYGWVLTDATDRVEICQRSLYAVRSPSACTMSSRAARAAGTNPPMRPMNTANSTPSPTMPGVR